MNGQATSAEVPASRPQAAITATVHARVMALVAAIRACVKKKAATERDKGDYSAALRSLREYLGDTDMLGDLLKARRKAAAEEDEL